MTAMFSRSLGDIRRPTGSNDAGRGGALTPQPLISSPAAPTAAPPNSSRRVKAGFFLLMALSWRFVATYKFNRARGPEVPARTLAAACLLATRMVD